MGSKLKVEGFLLVSWVGLACGAPNDAGLFESTLGIEVPSESEGGLVEDAGVSKKDASAFVSATDAGIDAETSSMEDTGAPRSLEDALSPVPEGCVEFGFGGMVCLEEEDFEDAQDTCRERGMQLIKLDSLEKTLGTLLSLRRMDLSRLESFVFASGRESYLYIGATDRREEGSWVWEDGALLEFDNWALNEPNDNGIEDCAVMVVASTARALGVWDDRNCGNAYGFVCEPN